MLRIRAIAPLAALAVVAACADSPTGMGTGTAGKPSLLIYDATHTFGNQHFSWIPGAPGTYDAPVNGSYNDNFMPKLVICELNEVSQQCVNPSTIHTYAKVISSVPRITSSSGSEWYNIRLMQSDLNVTAAPNGAGAPLVLTDGKVYRVTIKLLNTTIGLKDVKEVADFATAATVDTSKYQAHVAGQPLDMFWRIEDGAALAMDNVNGGTIYTYNGAVVINYDPKVLGNPAPTDDRAVWIQPADCDGTNYGVDEECVDKSNLLDGAFKIGPDAIKFFNNLGHLVMQYDPTLIPSGKTPANLVIARWRPSTPTGVWVLCGQSGQNVLNNPSVNTVNQTVSCDIGAPTGSVASGIYTVWVK